MGALERNINQSLRKKRYGRCRICQRVGRLTREHVPPASAFNDRAYFEYYVSKVNDAELLKWETRDVSSRGIFLFTLCAKCNNKTGRQYGTDYVKFVQAFASVSQEENANTIVEAEVKDFFPLRVVKQAVSMMLSTSDSGEFNDYSAVRNPFVDPDASIPSEFDFKRPASFPEIYESLRTFVRKPNVTGLPPSVRLYAYAVANEGAALRTGVAMTASLKTQKVHWLVTVGAWPIHWILLLHGAKLDDNLLDLTEWAKLDFRKKKTETIKIPCRWLVGKYPLDFRSPTEFWRDHFVVLMRWEGFMPESDAHDDKLFSDAVSFARRRAKWTKEGYLMKEFRSGTYYEVNGDKGFLEGATLDEARAFFKRPEQSR